MANPDADVYPTATERAAETVALHQSPEPLVLWAGWFCPFAQRTWITLEEKGIPYKYTEVNPFVKEKHFLDINPRGMVPAIEYNGRAIYESLILCEFLEDQFPSTGPQMLPSDPVDRATARIWIDHVAKSILPTFMRVVQSQDPAKQASALVEFYSALRTFAAEVKEPFFLGETFSLVDVAIAPWIMRDHVLVTHRGYERAAASDAWARYAALVETRDSVLRTTSAKEHYTGIYARYLDNTAQSVVAKAVREGKPF
ncbi:glutathione S-transferase C-terminal-like protein [Cylindrobasidium torrendii FP15055 ss-10]|uniref:Glutathione S-transferase C-terminal-like protein n=1 Tax=Cylindrobasidium torrendii FP15055 ss-10 TaxID=1314674 RepID=A0A0D7BM81_9AGAR|nr:glutathione S-transferase C-terminal-like protein [Cylindrobasidium torrendii FP15055 ss-10]